MTRTAVGGSRGLNTTALALSVALMVVALVTAPTVSDMLVVLVPVAFLVVGWIVLRHDPDHVEGRLVLLTGVAWAATLVAPVDGFWVVPVGLMGTHLLLRFPDGALPTPRWKPFTRLCTAMIVVVTLVVSTASPTTERGDANPYFQEWTQPFLVLVVLLPLCLVGSIASVIVRHRRASLVERTQIRWLAAAAAAIVLLYVITMASSFGYNAVHGIALSQSSWFAPHYPAWVVTLQLVSVFSFTLIPLAFGIAITRFHLYDIDRIISRTTSYAFVTALVLATYLLVVTVTLRLLPDSSNLAVASATLAAAAVVRPAVRRVQLVVDRRFDRTRYDQVRTIEAFGDDVQQLVDPSSIERRLITTVQTKLQPAAASLWTRGPL